VVFVICSFSATCVSNLVSAAHIFIFASAAVSAALASRILAMRWLSWLVRLFTHRLFRLGGFISFPNCRTFSYLSLRQRARLLCRVLIRFLGFCFLDASCGRGNTDHLNVCSRRPRHPRFLLRCEMPVAGPSAPGYRIAPSHLILKPPLAPPRAKT
jgi:hypothetical protein